MSHTLHMRMQVGVLEIRHRVLALHTPTQAADIRATQESMQPVDRQHSIDKIRLSTGDEIVCHPYI
jgi:hypothetical protein